MKVSPREHHLHRVSGFSMQDCLNRSVKFLGGITRLMKVFYSVSETEKIGLKLRNWQGRNAVDIIRKG